MMALTLKEVKKIAHLARIKMEDSELEKHTTELNKIFQWIEQLQEVDTENVEPLHSIESHTLPFREDEVTETNLQTEVLKNTPKNGSSKYGYFVVPKVVE